MLKPLVGLSRLPERVNLELNKLMPRCVPKTAQLSEYQNRTQSMQLTLDNLQQEPHCYTAQ
jgi:hypothetical protein